MFYNTNNSFINIKAVFANFIYLKIFSTVMKISQEAG